MTVMMMTIIIIIIIGTLYIYIYTVHYTHIYYRGADKSLARPTSRCILFDGENISFDASLVLYIYIYVYIYIKLIFLQL
jgi:uncharacterized membrane protein